MTVNAKALRARIRSVDSTMHITKAMELVASSKIRRARERMENCRFYRSVLTEAFSDLSSANTLYSATRSHLPALYIVIAGDRGLAGGYNHNVLKMALESMQTGDSVLPIGRRAAEFFARRGYTSADDTVYDVESMTTEVCAYIAAHIKTLYDNGKIGAVYLVSTRFVSMLTQTAETQQLLPLHMESREKTVSHAAVLYEPDPESVLAAIIPEYLAGVLYSAVCESLTAELAARRTAMDTATKNAEEMIDQLTLAYNRARQSAITQEITEIIAGTNV